MILAVDPGSTQSAYVLYDPKDKLVLVHATVPNEEMRNLLQVPVRATTLVIEYMRPRGMPMSAESMDTMFELGRMAQCWAGPLVKMDRMTVKMALCGKAFANDANIRAALIDMFGGKQETKKGGKLYKIAGDQWSALALAVTFSLKK